MPIETGFRRLRAGRVALLESVPNNNHMLEEAMIGRRAMTLVFAASVYAMAPATIGAQPKPSAKPTLDYEFYKARVEPIFLKKKAGHTRCVVCHSESNNFLKLE